MLQSALALQALIDKVSGASSVTVQQTAGDNAIQFGQVTGDVNLRR